MNVFASAVLAAALLAGAATAQVMAWEQLPPASNYGATIDDILGLAFLPGRATAEGSLVTVGGRTLRLDPDEATEDHLYPWVYIPPPLTDGVRYITATSAGTLIGGAPAGGSRLDRSTDRGETWERDLYHSGTTAIFQTSLPSLVGPEGHGAIFVSNGRDALRSFGDGARDTWETLGVIGGEALAFGEVPPSDALPDGRLLAAVYNGITYSDGGGETWQPGAGAYGFARYIAYGFAFVPQAGHPYGGSVLAGVNDFAYGDGRDSSATVYRSEDGGASWARSHRFSPAALGIPNATQVVLASTPDGVVWAGVTYAIGPPAADRSAIARSVDGGATWEPAGYVGWDVRQLMLGPDGRMYAATAKGVWRTTEAAYAVAGEGRPDGSDLGVAVWPNPTGGPVTVRLALAAATDVAITVLDVRGRVVREMYGGPARDGQRFEIPAGLAPGTYIVRVEAERQSATASFTVAR